MTIRKNRQYTPLISQLLVGVMLLRALFPVGFMPDISALKHGKFEMVICTGFGAKTVAVDLDDFQHAPASHVDHTTNTLCPFFGLTSLALPILLLGILLPVLLAAVLPLYAPLLRRCAYFNFSAPPRAPPHLYLVF